MEEQRGNKTRCSVTAVQLLVTTVFSGSETHRAIFSRPLGIHSIFSQGVLVSQKLRPPTPFSRVKLLRVPHYSARVCSVCVLRHSQTGMSCGKVQRPSKRSLESGILMLQ